MKVLVTGGAGYIGSHTCIELLTAGHEVCVIDNLSNGHIEAIERVKRLSNKNLTFFKLDIRDSAALKLIFSEFNPESVIHFAGLKAVAESVVETSHYYDVDWTASLLNAMVIKNCIKFVLLSLATVYRNPDYLVYDGEYLICHLNALVRTKLLAENILNDWSAINTKLLAITLRYFEAE